METHLCKLRVCVCSSHYPALSTRRHPEHGVWDASLYDMIPGVMLVLVHRIISLYDAAE